MVSKSMTSALKCLGSMHSADEYERRCTDVFPWLILKHHYICAITHYTALPAQQLQSKPVSSTRCCTAAGDCFPGLVCTYTAKAAYATCVQPVATGQACGARLDGQTDAIGKPASMMESWMCIRLSAVYSCLRHWTYKMCDLSQTLVVLLPFIPMMPRLLSLSCLLQLCVDQKTLVRTRSAQRS